jgi:transposase-like protein
MELNPLTALYMPGGHFKPIDPEIKQKILGRVRLGTEPIAQIAREFGISDSTVHGWLERKVTQAPDHTASELQRLRRENAELYEILGRLTVDVERSKKKNRGE